ncbi:MAG TPA: hypothetical protein VFR37_04085, partial [Longimicrobium sp.]|nr:hypothetical protein [Longimicrobium sp.]
TARPTLPAADTARADTAGADSARAGPGNQEEEAELERMLALGSARSLYRMRPSRADSANADGRRGINYVIADTIELTFLEGEVDIATVRGLKRGVYLDPLNPDSARADSLRADSARPGAVAADTLPADSVAARPPAAGDQPSPAPTTPPPPAPAAATPANPPVPERRTAAGGRR